MVPCPACLRKLAVGYGGATSVRVRRMAEVLEQLGQREAAGRLRATGAALATVPWWR